MSLSEVLLDHGINTDNWSHELGKKSIIDLQAEIDSGEARLELIEGILTRIVNVVAIVVNVRLGDKLFILVEDQQIFFTGAIRQRGLRNISEKLKPGETPLAAAHRALQEEIGLDFDGEWISIGEEMKQQNSPSYPGLNSCYQIFNYQIILAAPDLSKLRFAEVMSEKISLFTLEVA